MKYLKLPFQRETRAPVLALLFASAISLVLVGACMVWTKNLHYGLLVWNLFLAWLPLGFALLARDALRSSPERTWRFWGLAALWLLFFPNAPYIFTDLVHLWTSFRLQFWIDLTLILLCALTGLVLGFVSLYLMQSVVARRFGRAAGWLFVVLATGLCSIGIYLGRFLRFNSWDVFLRPGKIYHGLDAWAASPMINTASAAFLVVFSVFVFIAYLMLYALTRLPHADVGPLSAENRRREDP
ncbi:MAG TPA: DUF1361 domain-containing protein [Candidatus Acidoferrum sp.]|nr:DUF1361 domain-containing protein [Candidatus Acidoferrum sp.]